MLTEKRRLDAVSNVFDVEDCVKHRNVRRVRPKGRTVVKGKVDVSITTEEHDEYSKRYDVSDAEAQDT